MLGFQIIKHSWIIDNSETVLIQKFEESGLEMALHHQRVDDANMKLK